MFLCVLGSGSTGNCTYVACGETRILIDAGLSYGETVRRLQGIGVEASTVSAVCLSHEHNDHRTAVRSLFRRIRPALYANAGTIEALERDAKLRGLPWNVFTTGAPFTIGELRIDPFSVPHDSYEPVGFVVSRGAVRIGIVTDMGMPTELIRQRLRNCRVAVVESNHEEAMLRDAERPWSLKQRIAGRQGHLSNEQAGRLVVDIAGPELCAVYLAHLSADCNRPELALEQVRRALAGCPYSNVAVKLTYPDRASEVIELDF